MRVNNTLMERYESFFLKQDIDYLTKFQHESSNFCGHSKIHKSKVISKPVKEQNSEYISCFQPKDLKLRLIVVGH